MADTLHVELVTADRALWSGEAAMVVARTSEGDLGALPGHEPFLGLLVDGVIEIKGADGDTPVAAAAYGGFLSIADDRVSILAEFAELAHEIDLDGARQELERMQAAGDSGGEATEALRRAEMRVRAAERVR